MEIQQSWVVWTDTQRIKGSQSSSGISRDNPTTRVLKKHWVERWVVLHSCSSSLWGQALSELNPAQLLFSQPFKNYQRRSSKWSLKSVTGTPRLVDTSVDHQNAANSLLLENCHWKKMLHTDIVNWIVHWLLFYKKCSTLIAYGCSKRDSKKDPSTGLHMQPEPRH